MEATGLMIGDWVLHDGITIPSRVIYIEDRNVIETEYNDMDGTEYFSPIPLTAEILEKNGLDPIRANLWCLPYMGNWKLFVGIGNDHLVPNHLGVTIYVKHVHELQHALRLCGLCELADNFKVE